MATTVTPPRFSPLERRRGAGLLIGSTCLARRLTKLGSTLHAAGILAQRVARASAPTTPSPSSSTSRRWARA